MIDRMSAGDLPPKPHTILRGPGGALRHLPYIGVIR